ncbi:SH3 domain protein [Izhakiella capsodis]|uniref:SH3 domain protein n=1 Tax=Izhakiella capsodis TaxID=1367852 RepID=A0A1I4VWC8_9GAMM|nr:TIGR04211 family SH3 domain-containing protein [Izhakiella capsodis]SFN05533.1 SH3 domain protein [Izhakiella capsodis]
MKKTHLISLTLLSVSIATSVYAEEKRYVSDELTTWLRSGPGNQYRLTGTVNAGEQVTLLQTNENTHYAQVRDANGRIAWIPLSQISKDPSLRTRVPQLEQQVKDLSDKLTNIDSSWKQRTADMQKKVATSDSIISSLKNENTQLRQQLIIAQKRVSAANVQLDEKQRAIIMQWFMYGGGVAGIGLLLGLLLPHMIPRRKKSDRWMS